MSLVVVGLVVIFVLFVVLNELVFKMIVSLILIFVGICLGLFVFGFFLN